MTFDEFAEHVQRLSARFNDNTLERRVMFLMTEVGEVAQEALDIAFEQERNPDADLTDLKERLGLELHDVVWNVFDLAAMLDIDLEAAFHKKIELNEQRRWE